MAREAKDYEHLIQELRGFTERQLRAHFELYEGYVKKLGEIEGKLREADPKTANYSYGEISELLRRRSVAFNGTQLHELFFENLTGKHTIPGVDLKAAITRDFGSMESWAKQAEAGLVSEPGWVVLVRCPIRGTLRNELLSQHHVGALSQQRVILALDGWEHSYFIDYATKKEEYFEMLEEHLDWESATKRFRACEPAEALRS